MRRLVCTVPELHNHLLSEEFVIKRFDHKFIAVGTEMALEQTINRAQKSPSGIIVSTKQKQFVAEWEIIYPLKRRNTYQECQK